MSEAEEELPRPSRPSLGMRIPVKPEGFFLRLYNRTMRLIGHVGQVTDMAVGSVRSRLNSVRYWFVGSRRW